jgi:superfamily II DNA or RNA helicase
MNETKAYTTMNSPTLKLTDDELQYRASKDLYDEIAIALEYPKQRAIRGQFGTKIKQEKATMIDRRSGLFPAGLFPRVCDHLGLHSVQYKVIRPIYLDAPPLPITEPRLEGVVLRNDQLELINKVINNCRGVIVAPTGSGKTILALGIISMWPKARSLILTHRLDILEQFRTRAIQYLPEKRLQILTTSKHTLITGDIVCSTIQTIARKPIKSLISEFDIIIVDEAHHTTTKKGQFSKFLNANLAPIKIGLTATLPTDRGKLLTMEAAIGPVIGRLTLEKGQEIGIITRPRITLIPIPIEATIAENKRYQMIYDMGVVSNGTRNKRIVQLIQQRAEKGKTALIIVTNIAHGDRLYELAKRRHIRCLFIHGSNDALTRLNAKDALQSKQIDCVICTDVWREGIDIPSLDCVVMAYGGKSETRTLQSIGRGLRSFAGKKHVEIIDFLDPYRYLAQHTIERIRVYVENGWLK